MIMVEIHVRQYINEKWVDLGIIRKETITGAMRYIDVCQKKLVSDYPGIITLRQNVNELLVVNLNHGPVRLSVYSPIHDQD
jgi:hypothetical protein